MYMFLAVATILLGGGLVPVALSGPVAAFVFVSAAKKKKLSRFHLFWLVIINGLLFLFIVGMLGHAGPAPGDIAICSIPIAIPITVVVFVLSKFEVYKSIGDDLQLRKYYTTGIVLIPVLQLLVMIAAVLFARSIE